MKIVPRTALTSLQDELDRITQNTRALVQPERLAVSERATAELFATGIEDRILRAGAQAPEFGGLLKRLVIFGGAISAPGNMTPIAEYNIWADPEAARQLRQNGKEERGHGDRAQQAAALL